MKRKRSAASRAPKRSQLKPLELGEHLERGVQPAYLLLGPERFLQEVAADTIQRSLLGDQPSPCSQSYDGPKANLAEVLDELRTFPFFGGGRRLVFVRAAGTPGGFLAQHGEDLIRFLQAPPKTSTLVLCADKLDRRLKTTKQLLAALEVVDCGAFDQAGLLRFSRQRAQHWGRPFARGADHCLLERLGGEEINLGTLDGEVRKLALAGAGPITIEEVERLASFGSSEQSFALVDRIAAGDVAGALTLLGRFLRDGLSTNKSSRTREATAIAMILLPTIRWDLARLLRARGLIDRGATSDQITGELRVYRGKRRFLERARRASRPVLDRRHSILRDADAHLRSSADPSRVLKDAVVSLALSERPPAGGTRPG